MYIEEVLNEILSADEPDEGRKFDEDILNEVNVVPLNVSMIYSTVDLFESLSAPKYSSS